MGEHRPLTGQYSRQQVIYVFADFPEQRGSIVRSAG